MTSLDCNNLHREPDWCRWHPWANAQTSSWFAELEGDAFGWEAVLYALKLLPHVGWNPSRSQEERRLRRRLRQHLHRLLVHQTPDGTPRRTPADRRLDGNRNPLGCVPARRSSLSRQPGGFDSNKKSETLIGKE